MAQEKIEVLPNLKRRSSRRSKCRKRFKPMVESLKEYTKNTTIHGIKYLGWKRRPFAEKIYWIVIFTICLISLGLFIHEIVLKWRHKYVILVEDDTPTPIYKIPFPAVTICPQYKIKTTEFTYHEFYTLHQRASNHNCTAYNEYLMKFQVAQQVCSYSTRIIMKQEILSYTDFLNKSHIDLLHKISPNLADIFNDEMENSCNIKLNNLKISTTTFPITVDTFSTILTSEGVCFTLNLDPHIFRIENMQTDYPYFNYGNNKGVCSTSEVSRIKINLGTSKSEMNTMCQPTYLGYKIILHSPQIYPTAFENYIAINHESAARIKVRPRVITTSETLRSYTPKQRQCYFIGERQLKFFKFYNRSNCKLECFANYTLQVYGCVHFAFPRGPGVPICGETINYSELYEMVDDLDALLAYIQDYPDKMEGIVFQNDIDSSYPPSCDCLSECNSIDYEYTTIAEQFDFDKIAKEIMTAWNYTEYNIDTPTEFEIFWESSKFKVMIRKQLYTFSDLVSHFGGLLGLFMGASILSIFEIIYFCVIRNCTKNYRRRINYK